jgi:hypothetical protein
MNCCNWRTLGYQQNEASLRDIVAAHYFLSSTVQEFKYLSQLCQRFTHTSSPTVGCRNIFKNLAFKVLFLKRYENATCTKSTLVKDKEY